MSFLTFQIGQCGNQLGLCFFDILASEFAHPSGTFYERLPWNPFFRLPDRCRGNSDPRPIARSLLVDMEPGVVQNAFLSSCKSSSPWTYLRRNCLIDHGGSGNNWAMGYGHHGPRIEDHVLDMTRREIESIDVLNGFLMMHSVAGGTGSGVGSFMTEALNDAFPKSAVLNYCIWPFEIGEVIVQSYNAMLTLSKLIDASHGIIVAENDALVQTSPLKFRSRRSSFEHMNQKAMRSLAGCLLPSKLRPIGGQATSRHTPGGWSKFVADVISTVCPSSDRKLLRCHSSPFSVSDSRNFDAIDWDVILQKAWFEAMGKRRRNSPSGCFGSFWTFRGRDAIRPDLHPFLDLDRDENRSLGLVGAAYSPTEFGGRERSISCVINARTNIGSVADGYSKARKMFNSKAFLHQYGVHGIQRSEFLEAFEKVERRLIDVYDEKGR